MGKYIYSGISLQNKRVSNMDSLLLKIRQINGEEVLLAVVCDGVGSLQDGAFASGAAAKGLGEWFNSLDSLERVGMKMRDATQKINTHIVQAARHKNIRTASALSAMFFSRGHYYIAHVGDSRVYVGDSRALSQLTCDDVSETGALTAYIGKDSDLLLQYLEGDTKNRTFLICSDGLYKRMDTDFLIKNIRADNVHEAKNSVNALTQHVIERGEKDNITAVLIKTTD